jgi:hypothetical protein
MDTLKSITFAVMTSMLLCFQGGKCSAQSQGYHSDRLFDSDDVLNIRLSGDIRSLVKDRSNDMEYHDITLSYKGNDSAMVSIPIRSKTRGHYRRTQGNCAYPPLWLNFAKKNTPENSLFYGQDKIKLTTPCRSDKYVVREYLVYRLFNLVTPKSFKARLVKVVYDDTEKKKESDPLYGFLLEYDDQMAERNHATIIDGKLVKPEQTKIDDFLKMAVFEFLIGNTDWSVQYYQNVKLIAPDSISIPSTVPYDFDHAGIVGAPYARPAEELLLSSTRQRRYRGYCINTMSSFDDTFALFNELKEDIYNVYTKCPLLEESYIKSTVKFLDEFYETINNEKSVKAEFGYPCDERGTGNVVIKGLREQ